ncbi:MAG: sugar phosphate isomerase/epimerase [Deltaproteobacteria bacterium]|jgi:sugar phosphate isomerase/epimerase|nr:sugar phosphate isomerase/epimerase [Deltaproteobacteria bacterium]
MRLSISNIAWDISEDALIADILADFGLTAIDIAPGKYFPAPHKATKKDIQNVRHWWNKRGVAITGMQSLLFGTEGLNVFGDVKSQSAMLRHLEATAFIAVGLGAEFLVFGSPKNRDRSGLSDLSANSVAIDFFRRLGDMAATYAVCFCLEPNPPCYGANFMVDSLSTAEIVRKINHPNIKMQLDLGAAAINGENVNRILKEAVDLIGHIHLSEPSLLPLGDSPTDHNCIGKLLNEVLPSHIACIEMLTTAGEPHCESISRALKLASACYGGASL